MEKNKNYLKVFSKIKLSKEEEEEILKGEKEFSEKCLKKFGKYPSKKFLEAERLSIRNLMIMKKIEEEIKLSKKEEKKILKTLDEESKKHFEMFGEYHSKKFLESERLRINKFMKLEKYINQIKVRKAKTSIKKISKPFEIHPRANPSKESYQYA